MRIEDSPLCPRKIVMGTLVHISRPAIGLHGYAFDAGRMLLRNRDNLIGRIGSPMPGNMPELAGEILMYE